MRKTNQEAFNLSKQIAKERNAMRMSQQKEIAHFAKKWQQAEKDNDLLERRVLSKDPDILHIN